VDPELRLISAQIYNDAMVEFQEESGQLLFPMATLPWWDVGAAVTEAKRAHANGLHGININSASGSPRTSAYSRATLRRQSSNVSDMPVPPRSHERTWTL
jgi:hypothetical protein